MAIGRERRASVTQGDKAEGLRFGGGKMLVGATEVFLGFLEEGF